MYVVYLCILAPLLQVGIALLYEEETDLIPLSSNYDDGVADIKDPEIWNSKEYIVLDTISKPLLQDICKNSNKLIYVTQEDVTIDCKSFFSEQTHDVKKREADDSEVGSGLEGNIMDATEAEDTPKIEEDLETTQPKPQPKTTLPPKITNALTEENDSEEQKTTAATIVEAEKQKVKSTTVKAEDKDDKPTIVKAEEDEDETTIANTEEDETTVKAKEKDETTVKTEEDEDETTIANTEEEETTVKTEEIVQSTTNTEEKEQHAETPLKPTNKETKPKEVEDMTSKNEKETNDVKRGKGKTLIQNTKENNEENKNDSEDSVQTKESTSETKKAGSKDTTILVVLFVAVVVVGAAAFGYNFIKKRRQQSADLERVERVSPIKRSFQNLTKAVEGEAEKNPLLNDKKEVEMIDMKKPVENGEKA